MQSPEDCLMSCLLPQVQQRLASLLADLCKRYQEPWRHYHTLTHLNDCMGKIAVHAQAGHLQDPVAVSCAMLWHDAIYLIGRRDNEECSADLALQELQPLHWLTTQQLDWIHKTIVLTKHAKIDPATLDADQAIVLDVDMSILSVDANAYSDYAAAIRREYTPDLMAKIAYDAGRSAFLSMVLKTPRIYYSTHYGSYEQRARNNLQHELDALKPSALSQWVFKQARKK